MKSTLFSLRSMLLGLLAAVAFTATAVACPDLSGSYQYPGLEGMAAVCEKTWEGREDLPLPGPGGFYISAFEAHPFVVEQRGCETLVIHTRVGLEFPPRTAGQSEEKVITLDLRKGSGRKVEWGEDSLFIQQKFVPEGARMPWSRNVWELSLKKLEGGGLEYHLRHWEQERTEGDVKCGLVAPGEILESTAREVRVPKKPRASSIRRRLLLEPFEPLLDASQTSAKMQVCSSVNEFL